MLVLSFFVILNLLLLIVFDSHNRYNCILISGIYEYNRLHHKGELKSQVDFKLVIIGLYNSGVFLCYLIGFSATTKTVKYGKGRHM